MSKLNGSTKKAIMSEVYRPGMAPNELKTAVAEAGGEVSARYARSFIGQQEAARAAETAVSRSHEIELLRESIARLEIALNSPGWRRLTMQADNEFSPAGIKEIARLALIMRIKNPIIKRGVNIQRLYVWAQGVEVSAPDDDISVAVNTFLDDERNKAILTSHQQRSDREVDLQTEGNLFFRFFVDQTNGRVRLRTIPIAEIDDVITNPEDNKEPWFYCRTFTRANGSPGKEYYPDFRFNPVNRLDRRWYHALETAGAGPGSVVWETPIYHVKVNPLGRFGVCEFYDALDWALAFKGFLEQLAAVWAALARWAAKLTVGGGKAGIAAAKTKLNTTIDSSSSSGETNPAPVTASTFLQSGETDLQPFRTAGATMSAEDGRRLLLMAIMGRGFGEHFYSDVSTGNLATAKSLDRPTELLILDRQKLWQDIYKTILDYAMLWAVKAPKGALNGFGKVDRQLEPGRRQYIEGVVWNENTDGSISINFPPIVESDVSDLVGAISDAVTFKGKTDPGPGLPIETAVREFVKTLGISDPDRVMEDWRQIQIENEGRDFEAGEAMSDLTAALDELKAELTRLQEAQ